MDNWRRTWREGLAPQLSTRVLRALREGLLADDEQLLQGATTTPSSLPCVGHWPVEGACALGYYGWKGEGLGTVAAVEEFFARVCFKADQVLHEPAACRWFLNWFDDTPRDAMRTLLLAEVERTLARRPAAEKGGFLGEVGGDRGRVRVDGMVISEFP